ncbi:hypothetical protein EJ357_21430 [Streptomyces cyaneochromogenes]|uniref:Uncharacterized protein n=1 Tax=Streptomyces cyaneochromogenes TaxID=2496836 RepID=A0A3S9M9B9_9ACTN|nr:hypothetical protein EJ357_21430 [Streptomyces cyaneochromogenes]
MVHHDARGGAGGCGGVRGREPGVSVGDGSLRPARHGFSSPPPPLPVPSLGAAAPRPPHRPEGPRPQTPDRLKCRHRRPEVTGAGGAMSFSAAPIPAPPTDTGPPPGSQGAGPLSASRWHRHAAPRGVHVAGWVTRSGQRCSPPWPGPTGWRRCAPCRRSRSACRAGRRPPG